MAAPSISDSFANAPASSDNTNLVSAFDTLYAAFATAGPTGTKRFSQQVQNQLQDELVIFARRVSTNLQGEA